MVGKRRYFAVVSLLVCCCTLPSLADICDTVSDISCTQDVADTFLSIHNSVVKKPSAAGGAQDVVIVIDEGALKAHQHYWTKQFIRMLSEVFVISPEHTRLAVVTYSTAARVIVSMASNADICSFTASINNMTMIAGNSYLNTGLTAAVTQLRSGRSAADKLTILVTNGDWGNLGPNPEANINTLKSMGHVAAVILRHPGQSIGVVRNVIFDSYVSFFGSKKLGFTVDMTPEYLRELHDKIVYHKAVGADWPLDLAVSKTKCAAVGRTCQVSQKCICEARTISSEYICVGADVDPPEAVLCEGPTSPVLITGGNMSTAVTWMTPLFSDNSGVVNSFSDKLPGLYQVGDYTVKSTATDMNRNTATCTFSFAVAR